MTSSATSEPVHEAVLYTTAVELAELLAPRVVAAVQAGEPVVAVLDESNAATLAESLGAAGAAVEFHDPAQVHLLPAFTVATRWARLSRRATAPAGRATVIGQHVEDLPGIGPEHWPRLEMALDIATAGLPITVLCPCRADCADLDLVHATHQHLVTPTGARRSTGYRPPHEAVVQYPPPPPPDLGPPDLHREFTGASLSRLRREVATRAAAAGLGLDRISDMVLAVNEIASNSVEHGPGSGRLRIWVDEPGLIAEVADRGRMDVPFPGLTAPPPQGDRGRGLWLASELSDVLQVWSDDTGTVVRIRTDR